MSEERIATLNEEGEPVATSEESSDSRRTPGDLIDTIPELELGDTVEDAKSEETKETETKETDKTEEEVKSEETETKEEIETKEEEQVPWHKDPRWVSWQEEKKELKGLREFRERTEPEFKALKETVESLKPEEKKDFEDILDMSDEDLKEKFDENPKALMANLARQVRSEVLDEVRTENKSAEEQRTQREQEAAIEKTYSGFAKDNPGFDEMWDSGELKKYMDENPGHNAISAFYALSGQKAETDIKTKIDEAVKKAQKETEEKMTKQFKLKQHATVLGSGPASVPKGETPPELTDSDKYGGVTSVLAKRSLQRDREREA